ncbi:glycoside hydrolase family 16 protein [Sphingosinicella terrae]|uniref:glycoside hydrolase family 16 protein n=1 Tax=Sphingosinicella terrae TaxID=2172047 RepID=UPI000E0D6EE5|nr:glycoside hydrolase family 16 protein [Sphingosinicella terrae]
MKKARPILALAASIAAIPVLPAAAQMPDPAAAATSRYLVDVPIAAPQRAPDWADEFDGAAVDRSKWRFDTHRNRDGWYNDEAQYYSDGRTENARVEDGRLIIEARRERIDASRHPDWGGQDYTSARMLSTGEWTHGFYEIRAKLPCGRGTWPAIWMLPRSGGWPDGGEIDILEHVGHDPGIIHANVHTALFNHTRNTHRGASIRLPTACTGFHRYQLDWRPGSITIGVDGRGYMRVANDQPGGAGAWPFATPFHLILNIAVGGGWGGAQGIDDAALPQRMEVDYVRVWSPGTE